ncbi:MAG: hypothetical protein ACRDL5_18475 [Solirubrobacteraceae bacterium]
MGGLIAGALPAGAVVKVLGAKTTVMVGFVLLGVGSLLGTATSTSSTTLFVSIWMAVLCAGSGLAFTAATSASVSQLTEERSGVGASIVQAFQKTAGPFGTAIMGSILAAAYQSHLHLTGLAPGAASTSRSSVIGGITVAHQVGSTDLADAVRSAFAHGIDIALLASTAIAATGFVLALVFLPSARRTHTPAPANLPARGAHARHQATRAAEQARRQLLTALREARAAWAAVRSEEPADRV